MTIWLYVEGEGLINMDRIVAMGRAEAAPVRRLVQATPATHLLILTGGRKRQTLIVLDSGHVIVASLTPEELMAGTGRNGR